MKILVNSEPLDFTLENEDSVGQVVDSVADWLSEGQFAITDLELNGDSHAIHDRESWASVPVSEVDLLQIDALPLSEMDQVTVHALDQYLALLESCLTMEHPAALPELSQELPYVRERLNGLFPGLRGAESDLLSDPTLASGSIPVQPARQQILDQIHQLRVALGLRLQEYVAPDRELALTLGRLVSSEASLIQVPVQLQTGETSQAMRVVGELAENLSCVLRILPRVTSVDLDIDGIRSFAEDLTPHLAELRDAFESKDTVLVGDLLEYEIAPLIAGLSSFIKEDSHQV